MTKKLRESISFNAASTFGLLPFVVSFVCRLKKLPCVAYSFLYQVVKLGGTNTAESVEETQLTQSLRITLTKERKSARNL